MFGESSQFQKMELNDTLRCEFVDVVNYSIHFVLSEDPSFENMMKITDTSVTSVTEAVGSKGKLMKSIATHSLLTLIYIKYR